MKLKFVFCFIPKMRQGWNGMAKAIKFLPLLLASSLVCVSAHSSCYDDASFGRFKDFTHTNECGPAWVAHNVFQNIYSQDDLVDYHESFMRDCVEHVRAVWDCPAYNQYSPNHINQIHNRWKAEINQCKAHITNEFNQYNGRMCK